MRAYDYDVTCRPISTFPGTETPEWERKHSPFRGRMGRKTPLTQSLDELGRELYHLDAETVVLEVDLEENQIRHDGWPYANARPRTPRVVLSFDSKHGPLRYPCDTFLKWEDNVRAITLALESLRRVDRYGVTRHGEQYTGWKRLPGKTGPTLTTREAAACVLREVGGNPGDLHEITELLENASRAKEEIRTALRATHPDTSAIEHGGDRFVAVQAARACLSAHHGVSL